MPLSQIAVKAWYPKEEHTWHEQTRQIKQTDQLSLSVASPPDHYRLEDTSFFAEGADGGVAKFTSLVRVRD